MFPKARSATPAVGTAPVPVRATVCVDPGTALVSSVIVRFVAGAAPTAVGVNVTCTTQLALDTNVFGKGPQVLSMAAYGAVVAMAVRCRSTPPVFVNVTFCAAVVWPTLWAPNGTEEGATPIVGTAPVPLRFTVVSGFPVL
jgi:hypothetical protein